MTLPVRSGDARGHVSQHVSEGKGRASASLCDGPADEAPVRETKPSIITSSRRAAEGVTMKPTSQRRVLLTTTSRSGSGSKGGDSKADVDQSVTGGSAEDPVHRTRDPLHLLQTRRMTKRRRQCPVCLLHYGGKRMKRLSPWPAELMGPGGQLENQ